MGAIKQTEVKGKTVKIDKQVMYKLRMKYQRAKVTDIQTLNHALETQLAAIVKQDAKPAKYQLDIMGEMLDFVIENIEREEEEKAAKERSSEEWRRMEYEYQRVADGYYSMFTIEALAERDDRIKIESYRECSHVFCINAFRPRRKNQAYCSDECRKKEHDAQKEFTRTSKIYANGTYLPTSAYLSNRGKTEQEKYEAHELLFEAEPLQRMQMEQLGEVKAPEERKEQRMRQQEIKNQMSTAKHGEVITYKLSEMTAEQIEETFKDSRIKGLNPSSFSR